MKPVILSYGYYDSNYEIQEMREVEYTDIRELIRDLKAEQLFAWHFDGTYEFTSDPDIDGDISFININAGTTQRSMTIAMKYSH